MPPSWKHESSGSALTAYEALQPPLYYWLMTLAMRILNERPLPDQVMAIRWLGVAIASLIIPLVFHVGRAALGSEVLALCAAAAVALMPGMALDVARVGNDCVAVVLFTLLTWLGLELRSSHATYRTAVTLGIALGLGLLAKAYFLAAVPAVVLLGVFGARWMRVATACLIAAAISAWWYMLNLLHTGTLAGLAESVMLKDAGPAALIRGAAALPWMRAIDAILFSHLYFGGWSSLTVRSWMYHLFYAVIVSAAIGLWRSVRRPEIGWMLVLYACFWAAQCYNVVLLYLSKGLPASMGWYLYAVIAAESVLCVCGLAQLRRWAVAAGAVLFGLLDLYTMHGVAIPYYTGLLRHKAGGALESLHVFRLPFERLAIFKGSLVSTGLVSTWWALYLVATVAIAVTAIRASRGTARV
jgi:hypothetical protein